MNQYPIKNGKASLGLHPGLHRITVQALGYVTAEWSLNADPSSTHVHQFKLLPEKQANTVATGANSATTAPPNALTEPPKSDQHRTPTAAYVGLAATGVFAVAATVTGVMALSQQSKFNDAKDRADRQAAQDASDPGKTLALISDISLGATLLSAGITTYMFLASASKSGEAKAGSTSGKPRASTGQQRAASVAETRTASTNLQFIPIVGRGNLGLGFETKF